MINFTWFPFFRYPLEPPKKKYGNACQVDSLETVIKNKSKICHGCGNKMENFGPKLIKLVKEKHNKNEIKFILHSHQTI
jgi:hypothetical protein